MAIYGSYFMYKKVTGFGVIKTWTLLLDLFFQILNRLVASFVSQLMPMTHIG